MPPVLKMPRKKATDDPQDKAATEGQPERTPAKVFTVRVAKDLVSLAKRVAVLRGMTQEEYANLVLEHCIVLVNNEITQKGILGVRDRAEQITSFANRGGYSTFITVEDRATKLTSLAGQCLTSVAKLLDPYLRRMLEADYESTLKTLADAAAVGVKQPQLKPSFWDLPDVDVHYKFGMGGTTVVEVSSSSMIESDIRAGDFVFIRRDMPQKGDTVVVWTGVPGHEGSELILAEVVEEARLRRRLLPRNKKYGEIVVDLARVEDQERVVGVYDGTHRTSGPGRRKRKRD